MGRGERRERGVTCQCRDKMSEKTEVKIWGWAELRCSSNKEIVWKKLYTTWESQPQKTRCETADNRSWHSLAVPPTNRSACVVQDPVDSLYLSQKMLHFSHFPFITAYDIFYATLIITVGAFSFSVSRQGVPAGIDTAAMERISLTVSFSRRKHT